MEKEWGLHVIAGSNVYDLYGGYFVRINLANLSGSCVYADALASVLCSHAKTSNATGVTPRVYATGGNSSGGYGYIGFVFNDQETRTLQEIKDWFDAQITAGTPVMVAYKVFTPAPLTHTAQLLTTLPQTDRYTPR